MKKHILIATYGGGHVKMIIPVAQALVAHGHRVSILGLTLAAKPLKEANLPFFQFKNFIDDSDAQSLAMGKALFDAYPQKSPNVDDEESIAYLGLCYSDLIHEHGEAKAKALYQTHERQCFHPKRTLLRIIKQLKPDLVIATNSPRAERAAIAAAQSCHIPTLILSDLFSLGNRYRIDADKICVLSSISKHYLMEQGVPENKIVITGNPAFDRLYQVKVPTRKNPFKRLLWVDQDGMWDRKKNIIYLHTDKEKHETLDTLQACAKRTQCELIIRPHPSQHLAFYEQWMKAHPNSHCTLDHTTNLTDAINQVDAVITRTSTVALEALLLQCPVIQWLPKGFLSDLPLAENHLAQPAHNASSLEDAIHHVLSTPTFSHYPESILPTAPATPKILKEIEKLLHSSRVTV